MHGFIPGGLYSPPEPCEACFIMDALYLTAFGLLNRNTRPCHYKDWDSKNNF